MTGQASTTTGSKELKLLPTEMPTLFRIGYHKGGQVPEELLGYWQKNAGLSAIAEYQNKKQSEKPKKASKVKKTEVKDTVEEVKDNGEERETAA